MTVEIVPRLIWFDGEILPWEQATVHVWSEAVLRGLSVFEGIRGYWREGERRHHLLHLGRHLERLRQSARAVRMSCPYSAEQLTKGIDELLVALGFEEHVYVRPTLLVERGRYAQASDLVTKGFIAVLPVQRSLSVERGVRCQVSSWRRSSDVVAPPRVKAGANYYALRLARLEAAGNGFDEAILLNQQGTVAETAGASVFVVRGGRVATPLGTDSVLESITRASVLDILGHLGIEAEERSVDRTELYVADEVFLTGTLCEVTPVVCVDGVEVADGRPGAVTRAVQRVYQGICAGDEDGRWAWTTPSPRLP